MGIFSAQLKAVRVTVLLFACGCGPAAGRLETQAAVRDVLTAQVEAWNRGDLEEFMQGYWNSPELTFFSGGRQISGWEQTLQRYERRYRSDGEPMGALQFTDVKIDLLSEASALVRGQFHLERSTGVAEGRFTLVFRRLPQGWKIIHDHTSSG